MCKEIPERKRRKENKEKETLNVGVLVNGF